MHFWLTVFSTYDGFSRRQTHCKLMKIYIQILSVTVQRVLRNLHAHVVHIVIKIQSISNVPEDSRTSCIWNHKPGYFLKLASFTQHSGFGLFCAVVYIGTSFLFIDWYAFVRTFYPTLCLYNTLLIKIWTVSSLGLLWIRLLWTFLHR